MLSLEQDQTPAGAEFRQAQAEGRQEAAMDMIQAKMASDGGHSNFQGYQSSMDTMREDKYKEWANQQPEGSVAGSYAEANTKLQATTTGTSRAPTSGENKGEGL